MSLKLDLQLIRKIFAYLFLHFTLYFSQFMIRTFAILSYFFIIILNNLEGQTCHKHILNKYRRWHQVLQFQIENPLQSLHAQGTKFGQFAQQTTKVMRFLLCISIVGDVIAKTANDLHLKLLHLFGFSQAVTFCK